MKCAGCGARRNFEQLRSGYGDVVFGRHEMAIIGNITIRVGKCGVCGKMWRSAEINIRDMSDAEHEALRHHADGASFEKIAHPDRMVSAEIRVDGMEPEE